VWRIDTHATTEEKKIKSKVETTKKETQDPGKVKGGLKLVVSSQ